MLSVKHLCLKFARHPLQRLLWIYISLTQWLIVIWPILSAHISTFIHLSLWPHDLVSNRSLPCNHLSKRSQSFYLLSSILSNGHLHSTKLSYFTECSALTKPFARSCFLSSSSRKNNHSPPPLGLFDNVYLKICWNICIFFFFLNTLYNLPAHRPILS